MMTTLFSTFARTVYIVLIAMTALACGEESDKQKIVSDARLQSGDIAGEATNCAVVLRAQQGTSFTITVDADWCAFSDGAKSLSSTMETTDRVVYIYFSRNETDNVRSAGVEVSFSDGAAKSLSFTQGVYDKTVAFVRDWPELPVCQSGNGLIYVAHYGEVDAKSNVRNYTVCFDPDKRAALWVAYPLHSMYTSGSADRDNSRFDYDPSVSTSYQANLAIGSYSGRYDRGHQLPAADRKCSQQMMDQTFYATNMTPQQSNFNRKLWGNMEGRVRSQVCADTLYVVTGAWFDGERDSSIALQTNDRSGNRCPIPTDYFKILLRTKSGNTRRSVADIDDPSQLKAIGFWFKHRDTGSDTSITSEYCMSVADIERMTGNRFDFFPMLDEKVAAEVKAQCDPSAWGITR